MAKARAIVKRRKAVRNIRKITKTMQMIATAKFQKSLKRAVGTKPYTRKVRELVGELAATRRRTSSIRCSASRPRARPTNRIALVVITSNRGLAGAYNGSVLRAATHFIRQQEAAGKTIDLYVVGQEGRQLFQLPEAADRAAVRPVRRHCRSSPTSNAVADQFIEEFTAGKVDAVYVAYMNFISAGSQKPDVMQLLPLAAVAAQRGWSEHGSGRGAPRASRSTCRRSTISLPTPQELLDELLPLTVKTALFQAFLDATTSEHVARMIAMKSATDNADKMVKALTMQYNRARQSQITTELSEIMGGVEAMKG